VTGPEEDEHELVDAEAFRVMAGECGWSVHEFARFYAEGSRKELAGLSAAVAGGDLQEVARLAHGARGSSAAACVPAMAEAFYELEEAAMRGARLEVAAALARAGTLLAEVLAFLTRRLGPAEGGQSPS
jgi:HPt (histidine-containing phosphotransfer) domain-containing protein